MLFEKLKNKGCSKYLPVILLTVISGCSNLSLKDGNTPPPVKNIASQNTKQIIPAWINSLIADLNSKPVKDSPESILQYQYKGKLVFYFAPACCGKMSSLYDQEKKVICQPDGGEDGKGDGKCPGFITERINEKLIWAENRD